MQDAQKKLEEAKRKESLEDQRAAREELEKAKAELEEILRQLREEEIARTLAKLEARFRKMLEMQLAVYESTRRLDQLARRQARRAVPGAVGQALEPTSGRSPSRPRRP